MKANKQAITLAAVCGILLDVTLWINARCLNKKNPALSAGDCIRINADFYEKWERIPTDPPGTVAMIAQVGKRKYQVLVVDNNGDKAVFSIPFEFLEDRYLKTACKVD